jgi:exopolyphosphatase / guanosine-5'-triphosphate,3'-diphosphate pyrophosphatase
LQVLSGREEARIAALAVANSFDHRDAVTLDLGGGSVQLSRLGHRRWGEKGSWPLGAVRAQERFLRRDPPRAKGVAALCQAVRTAVNDWRGAADGLPLIGMGGTIRNPAGAQQKRNSYPLSFLHGYAMPADAVQSLAEELLALNCHQRAALGESAAIVPV